MLEKIKGLFPVSRKKHDERLGEVVGLLSKADSIALKLRLELQATKEQNRLLIQKKKENILIDVFAHDPSPIATEGNEGARKEYVGRVASFHVDILKKRLEFMISKCMHILKDLTLSDEDSLAVRGTIYAYEEEIRWADSCVKEHVENNAKNNDDPK